MKTNKILALILSLAMIMSTMGIVASADGAIFDVNDDASLQDALQRATDGDVIQLAYGEYAAFNVDTKGVTVEGVKDANNNNPKINIDKEYAWSCGGVNFNAENITFKNLDFIITEDWAISSQWYDNALGHSYESTAARGGLTVENCNFINKSQDSGILAIMANTSDYTITGCTFTGFSEAVRTEWYASPECQLGTVVITNNTYTDVARVANVLWGKANSNESTITITDNTVNPLTDGTVPEVRIWDYSVVNGETDAAINTIIITNNNGLGDVVVTDKLAASTVTSDAVVIKEFSSVDIAESNTNSGEEFYLNYGSSSKEVKAQKTDKGIIYTEISSPEGKEAFVNGVYYDKFTEALNYAATIASETNPVTVQLMPGEISEGTIELPLTMNNVTIKGASSVATLSNNGTSGKTVIKDTVIQFSDKANASLENISFDGIVFDNSRIYVNSWKTGVSLKNWAITNCEFNNIYSASSVGGVIYFSLSSGMIVGQHGPWNDCTLDGFTFTNNVVSGANCNGVCSAINIQAVEGTVVIENNTFENVDWNAIQLQHVPETAIVSIKNNTFKNIGSTIIGLTICTTENFDVEENIFIANSSSQRYIGIGTTNGSGVTIEKYPTMDVTKNFWGYKEGNEVVLNENYLSNISGGEEHISKHEPYYINEEKTQFSSPYATVTDANGKSELYYDLAEAVAAANPGDVITIGKDIVVDETVVIDKNLTIDGTDAKYTIKGADGVDSDFATVTPIKVVNADVTLKNLTILGGGGDLLNSTTVAAYGAYAVIAENANLTIENSTLTGGNVNTDYVAAGGALDIVDSNVIVKESLLESGRQAAGLTDAIAFPVIIVDDATDIEISNSTIRHNSDTYAYRAELIERRHPDDPTSITEKEEPVSMSGNIVIDSVIPLSGVKIAVPAGKFLKISGNVADDIFIPTSEITVNLVPVKDATDNVVPGEFYVELKASENTNIFEFASAEFTFNNSESSVASGKANMSYVVTGENGVEVIENTGKNTAVNDNKKTFGFFATNNPETNAKLTGESVIIAKITFDGKGDTKLSIEDDAYVVATKIVNADETYDEAEYIVTNDENAPFRLVIGDEADGSVALDTRNIVINVEFEHDIDADNSADEMAYKAITVTLKDSVGEIYNGIIDIKDVNKAVVTFDKEVLCGVITVTLKADGFRTYTYQTTFEDGKEDFVLNFWNSVKRTGDWYIEAGEDRSKMMHNFLVGDIAMDYIIDKYDLAAVTSYYGNYDIKTGDKYVRYDLNRDHQIDILDVAYVLHGMGN